ncbi:hypothetical protein ACQY0O_006677 [Thecaphora frezii]
MQPSDGAYREMPPQPRSEVRVRRSYHPTTSSSDALTPRGHSERMPPPQPTFHRQVVQYHIASPPAPRASHAHISRYPAHEALPYPRTQPPHLQDPALQTQLALPPRPHPLRPHLHPQPLKQDHDRTQPRAQLQAQPHAQGQAQNAPCSTPAARPSASLAARADMPFFFSGQFVCFWEHERKVICIFVKYLDGDYVRLRQYGTDTLVSSA